VTFKNLIGFQVNRYLLVTTVIFLLTAFVGFGATFLNVLGFLIKLSKSAVAFTYLILRGKHLSWQKHITMASF